MIKELLCASLACIAITGCSTIPEVPAGVSAEGVNYISASRWLGVVHASTFMYLPGEQSAETDERTFTCKNGGAEVTIISRGTMRRPMSSYCQQVLSSRDFVARIYPKHPVAIELHLVPAGTAFSERRGSLRLSVPRLSLVSPEFEDEARTRANITDLVSHEVFHLAGALAGDAAAGDEETAYWVGLCSQFSVLGRLDYSSLPGAALDTSNQAMNDSSAAAFKVRGQIAGLFTSQAIDATSPAGGKLADMCRERVPFARNPK